MIYKTRKLCKSCIVFINQYRISSGNRVYSKGEMVFCFIGGKDEKNRMD